jgi:methylthioribose-1-phosphate isomerase
MQRLRRTVEWHTGPSGESLVALIDQTRLPLEEVVIECRSPAEVAEAIRSMRVRGAPAIGVTAAYGIALAAVQSQAADAATLLAELEQVAQMLRRTRPTAVNLFWAIERMLAVARATAPLGVEALRRRLVEEAQAIADEDEAANRRMGALGATLLEDGDTVLTHCNTGALATVAYGTALGVLRAAHEQGKRLHVFVDETRPFLQGARLTAWELAREGIPLTLITDSMAGHFMQRGVIKKVIVGADRIAANGDVANKIGTYSLAVLARAHGIPFYVVAPTSTIDLSLPDGSAIPIEERSPDEVTHIAGQRIAPPGVTAAHPAFDVTPHHLVDGIITERGIAREPYTRTLRELVEQTQPAPFSVKSK